MIVRIGDCNLEIEAVNRERKNRCITKVVLTLNPFFKLDITESIKEEEIWQELWRRIDIEVEKDKRR